jgi:PAS domain-containing protein
LPIHRKGTASSGIVYAFQEEVDEWLIETGEQLDSQSLRIGNVCPASNLADLIELLPDLAWIADINGLVEYVNQRWSDYTGQLVCNPFPAGLQDAVHADDLQPARSLWKTAVETGLPFEATYRLRAQNGQYRWFLARANLHRDKKNLFAKWIGTSVDIHACQKRLMTLGRMSSYVADTLGE